MARVASQDSGEGLANVELLPAEEAAVFVMKWRQWCSSIKDAPVDKDQGSNAAPAYSASRMYECRHLLQVPPPAQLSDEIALNVELSSQWRYGARCFGAFFKAPGQVVYHQAFARCPGYCQPALLSSCEPLAMEKFWGYFCAAVGDRVAENRSWSRKYKTPRQGVITSIGDDNRSEVAVRWDDDDPGREEHCIWCGKKGSLSLVYA